MKERLCEILRIALQYHVNDIYFERKEKDGRSEMTVQMKIDDKIQTLKSHPGDEGLFTYIAYRAKMDLSDASQPQSGAFEETVERKRLSLRYGVVSSIQLKKGVLRILNQNGHLGLNDLTQDAGALRWRNESMQYREGLIVFSGPTGSGKTTSLYTLLHAMHDRIIYTLEDPVEVWTDAFSQIEVNGAGNLSYEDGIRQLMRQAPEVIMIGEIRDAVAAKAALSSSLTGHLVVTSIHSQSTRSAIARLMDLGIEKAQLREVLQGVCNQRLVDDHKGGLTGIYEIMDRKQLACYFENGRTDENFITLEKAEQAFEDSFRIQAFQSNPLFERRRL